jgi:hypothetical protein
MLKIEKQAIATADDVRNLKPLNLFIRVAGFGTCKMKLKRKPYKQINPEYIKNPAYSLEALEEEHRRLVAAVALESGNTPEKGNNREPVAEHELESGDVTVYISSAEDFMREAAQIVQNNDDGKCR